MEEEKLVLTRKGKIGSNRWEYSLFHYGDEMGRINPPSYFGKIEMVDSHYVIWVGKTDFRGSNKRLLGINHQDETEIADKRLRDELLKNRKYYPDAKLEEIIAED